MRLHACLLTTVMMGLTACGAGTLPAVAIEHNRVGAQLLTAGRLDQAEARFRLALEYRPRFAEPHANLGLVFVARGQLADAERELRLATELNEDFATAWSDLGAVLEREHHLDEARQAYEHALSIDPATLDARRNLAILLARQGLLVEARAHLLRYLELQPSDSEADGLLAWCELRLGRPAAADDRASGVLVRDADAATARLVRGVARAERGDLDGAAEDLSIAADRSLLGREARVRLAAVQALRGKVPEAQELVRALLREDEDDAAIQLVAAVVALAAEDAAGAQGHAERAAHARPDLREAHLLLARACELRGDDAGVRAALEGVDGVEADTLRNAVRH